MLISVLKSKIHLATITAIQPNYEGSIGIDQELMDKAGLVAGEKVHVLNHNNANRFETYCIAGAHGEISLRGPAAKLGKKGDKVVVLAYGLVEEKKAKTIKPRIVHVDARNRLTKIH